MGNDCFSLIRCLYSMLFGLEEMYSIPAQSDLQVHRYGVFPEMGNT